MPAHVYVANFRYKVIVLLLLSCPRIALAQTSFSSFETAKANAESARESGKISDAVRNYQAAIGLRPDWVEGYWYIGTLSYDADKFEQAIPALRRFVDLDPQIGAGWGFFGLCEFETGDYADSLIHLRKALDLGFTESPDLEKVVQYHFALLLNQRGEFEQARDFLIQAFGPGPFAEQIRTVLGLALLRVPLLPSQVDPAKDALVHAAGETSGLVATRDLDAASHNFEQMLKDYPGTPYLHYEYGTTLIAVGRMEAAELQLQQEVLVSPQSGLPWMALAKLQLQRKDFAGAQKSAERAIELAPHSASAFQILAEVLQKQSKPDEAAVASSKAQQFSNRPPELDSAQIARYSLKQNATFVSGAVAPTNTDQGKSSADFERTARLAESARQAGQLDRATTLYQEGLRLSANWQEGWRQLGTVLYMQHRYTEAIAALQQSVSLNANQPDTWTLLGLSEFETKDYKNSLVHLQRGRNLGFSGNASAVRVARYHLAALFNLNGQYDAAITLLTPETGPGILSGEIRLALGMALLRIPGLPDELDFPRRELVRSAGDAVILLTGSYYDKAFQIFDRMLAQYPNTLFLHYAYGDALASISRFDDARIQLTEETKLNPKSDLAYIRLASIALVLHKTADALENSRKAVALVGGAAEAHYVLGRSLLESGEVPAAVGELEIARNLSPNSPKVRFSLARAYAQANRASEAERERTEFERLQGQITGQEGSSKGHVLRGSVDENADHD